jgi:Tfp pilus assembly protein PilN
MPWIKQSLGVGFDDGRLKLVCLRATWRGPHLADSASFPLPPKREEAGSLAPEIDKFLLRNGIRPTDRVTFGVPRPDLFFRHLTTPPVKERNLPDLVGYECERHLPGAREEFAVGYQVLGKEEEGGYRLLLGAVNLGRLEEHLALLRRANLTPASLQPVPMALAEAFRHGHPKVAAALLISASKDGFTADFIEKGRAVLSRHFGLGTPVTPDGAEAGEKEDPSASWRRLADAVAERVSQKLFLESLPGGRLPPIYVHGSDGAREAIVERLGSLLKVPVHNFGLPAWEGSPSAPGGENVSAVAFGLALLGLKEGRSGLELSEERLEGLQEGPRYGTTAVLAAAWVAMLLGYYGLQVLQARRHLNQLEREVQVLRDEKAVVEDLSGRVQNKRQRLELLAGTIDNRVRQADLLKELTALIPDDTYLSDYKFKEGKVEISGLSPSASRLLSILEASPLFGGAQFSSSIVSQGKTLERFKIRVDVEGAGG